MNNVKLILGDTLEKLKEQPDESVHFVCTSPPYPGVEKMWGAFFAPDNFDNAHAWLDQVWDECVRILKPGCKLAINIGNVGRNPYISNASRVARYRNDNAIPVGEIIWYQGAESGNTAWGTYANPTDPTITDNHEYIILFRKVGRRESPDRKKQYIEKMDFLHWRNSVWQTPNAFASRVGHIAPFPIEIPKRLITLYTFEGDIVIDPFVGSGTTGIAASNLNRDFIGIDHDPKSIELAGFRITNAQADMGQVARPLKNNLVQLNSFA